MKHIYTLLVLSLFTTPVVAETVTTNNGDGTFTFGVTYIVPTTGSPNAGFPTDQDISGVSDSIGIALGLLLPCNAAAVASQGCTLGQTYKRQVLCTQARVDSADCLVGELGTEVDDSISVSTVFDEWLKSAIRSAVKTGRSKYKIEMGVSVPDTTELN